jgi:hypothetical protein
MKIGILLTSTWQSMSGQFTGIRRMLERPRRCQSGGLSPFERDYRKWCIEDVHEFVVFGLKTDELMQVAGDLLHLVEGFVQCGNDLAERLA